VLVARPAIGQARFPDMPQEHLNPADYLASAGERVGYGKRMAAKLQPSID
jgi:hypothetical protein